ncbi:MAG TPA: pyridoxamine 5'-phosphate oxidase, partial [Rhodospirillales bacterium]|nr:pyridoxamine 5'-phosphate oxidase [Rhodospirillales bacterium]
MSAPDDPLARFADWLAEAERSEPNDPNAMALATSGADGAPSVRMVLLKGADPRGFVFYTNLGSRKAAELRANPQAALCFHWKTLRRQVRVEGRIEAVGGEEADAYFATRARVSQLGAWASKQSQRLRGRFELEARVAKYTARFVVGAVPRP